MQPEELDETTPEELEEDHQNRVLETHMRMVLTRFVTKLADEYVDEALHGGDYSIYRGLTNKELIHDFTLAQFITWGSDEELRERLPEYPFQD